VSVASFNRGPSGPRASAKDLALRARDVAVALQRLREAVPDWVVAP
jgi:hypothetical protein